MIKPLLTACLSCVLLAPEPVLADAKAQFEDVYKKAETTHQDAGTFKWTTTTNQLQVARQAADEGHYDQALGMAEQALKLAEQSVAQKQQQKEAWRDVEIRN